MKFTNGLILGGAECCSLLDWALIESKNRYGDGDGSKEKQGNSHHRLTSNPQAQQGISLTTSLIHPALHVDWRSAFSVEFLVFLCFHHSLRNVFWVNEYTSGVRMVLVLITAHQDH